MTVLINVTYHDSIGENLDAIVAEGGGSQLKITKVACENLGGHAHDIVDHVNDDGWRSEVEKELGLNP